MKGMQSVARVLHRGLFRKHSPLLGQLVVTRYCNLDCAYCNEFDQTSRPIDTALLLDRVEHLSRLDTAVVTCTGGEPLTHPGLIDVIARIRARSMVATLNTNAFLLTRDWITNLNAAGLNAMQISIDGVTPSPTSKKSLKSVMRKLIDLSAYAKFSININSVFGPADQRPEEVFEVAAFAKAHGFSHSVALVHDHTGHVKPFTSEQREIYENLRQSFGSYQHHLNHWLFQKALVSGEPNDWKCRAGARYLYICEDGLVHWCSQNRGHPGIPLAEYGRHDIAREFNTVKPCAPMCTLSCVHQTSAFDRWRGAQPNPAPQHIPVPAE